MQMALQRRVYETGNLGLAENKSCTFYRNQASEHPDLAFCKVSHIFNLENSFEIPNFFHTKYSEYSCHAKVTIFAIFSVTEQSYKVTNIKRNMDFISALTEVSPALM